MLRITAAIFAATMFTSSTAAIRLVEGEDTEKPLPLPTNIEIEGRKYCYLYERIRKTLKSLYDDEG